MDVNGHAAAPHKLVKAGDALSVTFPHGKRTFVVKGITDKHRPKAEARLLYEETTPAPPPEVLEARRLERLLAPRREDTGKLQKKDRREREKLRGR